MASAGGMSGQQWLPRIDPARCTGCGECVAACPEGALALRAGRAVLARPEDCTYCIRCEDLCPSGAIELPFLICKKRGQER